MKRQLPKPHDFQPLLRFQKQVLSPKERRLAAALTIEDLRRIAKRRTPRAAFDYTDGAAEGEVSLARAREAFADVQFNPSILRDVSTVDTSRVVLGECVELPFGIAPTGFTRMRRGTRAGFRHRGPARRKRAILPIRSVGPATIDRRWFRSCVPAAAVTPRREGFPFALCRR